MLVYSNKVRAGYGCNSIDLSRISLVLSINKKYQKYHKNLKLLGFCHSVVDFRVCGTCVNMRALAGVCQCVGVCANINGRMTALTDCRSTIDDDCTGFPWKFHFYTAATFRTKIAIFHFLVFLLVRRCRDKLTYC